MLPLPPEVTRPTVSVSFTASACSRSSVVAMISPSNFVMLGHISRHALTCRTARQTAHELVARGRRSMVPEHLPVSTSHLALRGFSRDRCAVLPTACRITSRHRKVCRTHVSASLIGRRAACGFELHWAPRNARGARVRDRNAGQIRRCRSVPRTTRRRAVRVRAAPLRRATALSGSATRHRRADDVGQDPAPRLRTSPPTSAISSMSLPVNCSTCGCNRARLCAMPDNGPHHVARRFVSRTCARTRPHGVAAEQRPVQTAGTSPPPVQWPATAGRANRTHRRGCGADSSLAYTTFCSTCSSTLPPRPFSAIRRNGQYGPHREQLVFDVARKSVTSSTSTLVVPIASPAPRRERPAATATVTVSFVPA